MSKESKLILSRENKLLHYFIKKSTWSLSSDLQELQEEIINFSNEQLIGIVSNLDILQKRIAELKLEITRKAFKK